MHAKKCQAQEIDLMAKKRTQMSNDNDATGRGNGKEIREREKCAHVRHANA